MKLFTLNLHGFDEKNREEKLEKIVEYLKGKDCDIIFFFDACQKSDGFKIDNTLRVGNNAGYIALTLGYEIYFEPVLKDYEGYDIGYAILAKQPLEFQKKTLLSKLDDLNLEHISELVEVKTNNKSYFFTKLGFDEDSKIILEEVKNLLQVTNRHEEQFFLAGDFRYPDGSLVINSLKKHLFSGSDLAKVDPSKNSTYHHQINYQIEEDYEKPNNTMVDYIFTNIPLQVINFEIVFNKPENYVSSHNGLFIEFKN